LENLPTVLVIDDEEIVRNTVDALLSNIAELHFADNGIDGLGLALQLQPDLILMDVMMPLMNGFELCKKLRATPSIAEVPIIMITALDNKESRLKGLNSGADDFITKPFDSVELIARVQTITRLNRYRTLLEQRKELEVMHEELLISYHKTIEGWAAALDLRDKETEGHTERVTEKSVAFAKKLGLDDDMIEQVRIGAILHDIGKLGVPDCILHKPDKLTEEEWEIMRKHPTYAYNWLCTIPFLKSAVDIPYSHHEKWDGSGYPCGLKGEEIPLIARLFAIVDVWDALRSERPYRHALPEFEVLEMIREESGTHFDPALVKVFLKMQEEK
jgi:putative two-component system response regulator